MMLMLRPFSRSNRNRPEVLTASQTYLLNMQLRSYRQCSPTQAQRYYPIPGVPKKSTTAASAKMRPKNSTRLSDPYEFAHKAKRSTLMPSTSNKCPS